MGTAVSSVGTPVMSLTVILCKCSINCYAVYFLLLPSLYPIASGHELFFRAVRSLIRRILARGKRRSLLGGGGVSSLPFVNQPENGSGTCSPSGRFPVHLLLIRGEQSIPHFPFALCVYVNAFVCMCMWNGKSTSDAIPRVLSVLCFETRSLASTRGSHY